MGHEEIESCENWEAKYIICTDLHKVEEHCYKVNGCKKGNGKICTHFTVVSINYGGNYPTNTPHYISRYSIDIKT